MGSNTEINFTRLLGKCMELADNKKCNDWRFDKYVESLENYLEDLSKTGANKPAQDQLKEYTRKVEFLKNLSQINKPAEEKKSSIKLVNPGPVLSAKDTKVKQIFIQAELNEERLLRNELIGVEDADQSESNNNTSDLNMDEILAQEEEKQRTIAEKMIEMTQSMKENSKFASEILREDNKKLNEIITVADKNYQNLKGANEHLDQHITRCCNWWIWILVVVVFAVFIMMVMFMKFFSKKKYSIYDSSTAAPLVTSAVSSLLTNNSMSHDEF